MANFLVMLAEVLYKRIDNWEIGMTFDQWIDSVDAGVRGRLGDQVKTEELSWDSAHWVTNAGHVVASLDESEKIAKIDFDNGTFLAVPFGRPEGDADTISQAIADRLAR
jgi:hypothetical protein